MEIKVNRVEGTNNNTNNYKNSKLNQRYECAFCHKKYDTPEQRMECERKCSIKKKENEKIHEMEERKQKEQAMQQEAENDYKMLKNHCAELNQLIRNHNLKYKDNVHFTSDNKLIRDQWEIGDDSFRDFCNEFDNFFFKRNYI